MVAILNTVDIDPAALAADVQGAAIPTEPAPPPAPDPAAEAAAAAQAEYQTVQAVAATYRPTCDFAVGLLADFGAPNWHLTAAERDKLAESGSLVCAAWWPDGQIPLKWALTFGMVAQVFMIANARRRPDGSLPPLRIETPKADKGGAPAPAARTDAPVTVGG